MFEARPDPHLVPFDGSFRVDGAPTAPPRGAPGTRSCRKLLAQQVEFLRARQRVLYAQDHHAILLVFQAMDAAGKDGTIRAVTSGIDPTGFQIYSFKEPSSEDLDHDFLWRSAIRLPERGRIGVFNRSYYEEVLVVRVHPEFLESQRLPDGYDLDAIWDERFESIRDHELHLARNGIVILKFWLNVSRERQRRRFLERIDVPEKNWKFSARDLRERAHWDAYMAAYEAALGATSRPWAPWYAVPADKKPFMRYTVARIVSDTLGHLGLRYPELGPEELAEMRALRETLEP